MKTKRGTGKTYKMAWNGMSASAKKKYGDFATFEKAAKKWNADNPVAPKKKSSTYDKSNKGIQDNMSKGAKERRRGKMLDNDADLKSKFKSSQKSRTLIQKEAVISVPKKTVKSIPNTTKKKKVRGRFLEPKIESID
jgi:hypothetical protein